MTETGDLAAKYLYGIIRCAEARAFKDAAPLPTCGPVHTVPCRDLAAVVSDSPTSEYDSTRTNLVAHERVLERVLQQYTVLPVRFGTVAAPPAAAAAVEKLLAKRSQEFERLLADLDGKVELGLKLLWRDEKLPFEEIVHQSEGIRRLRQSLQGRPPEATHFERIHLGELIKQALDRKRRAESAALLAPLRRTACQTVENDILMDRMILNAAFLVERAREGEFDHNVELLLDRLGERVAAKYVGPVPPYNFVNIVVNWDET